MRTRTIRAYHQFQWPGLLLTALACGGATSGPCDVQVNTPIFEIRSVSSSKTGAKVDQLRLSNLTLSAGGTVLTNDFRQEVNGGPHYGVTTISNSNGTIDILCVVACGFGVTPARIAFTTNATGFSSKQVAYDVAFTSGHGGCPAVASGPTYADIKLDPAS